MILGDSMRKAAKERKVVKKNISSGNEVEKFIKILVFVLVFVAIFWLITILITNKDNKKTTTESAIQYKEILVGSILNREPESYYVLVQYKDDSNIKSYNSLINSYIAKDEHLEVYNVDLTVGFNEKYMSTKANLNIAKISDIKFSETTLLQIEKGKITKTVTGSDKITDFLTKLKNA